MSTKEPVSINASSMADIAFLLLIFFLVTTTMDIDKGLLVLLPPYDEQQEADLDNINKRNILEILVNHENQLLVDGELHSVSGLKDLTKSFVNNNGVNPKLSDSPQKAVVSILNDRGTSYDSYITVQNELRAAYNELRETYAQQQFGLAYEELPKTQQSEVKQAYPLRISEAEPMDFTAL
ncbi:MAG: ExbD/TolR family protein [Chitinophagales bacterium]